NRIRYHPVMPKYRWLSLWMGTTALACGGVEGPPALLGQAPHCEAGGDSFHVEGTLDGANIDDRRTTSTDIGLVGLPMPRFDTPYAGIAMPGPDQIELHLKWAKALGYGQTDSTTGDYLKPPMTHPRAGEKLCITAGEVGFVDGGSEDGVFKFHITGVASGADCATSVPVDLRGCY